MSTAAGEAMVNAGPFAIRATIMQTPTAQGLEVLADHVVTVGADGLIKDVVAAADYTGTVDVTLPDGDYLLPGMIDLHIHAPQWPQLGAGLDRPLEDWLFSYTFPLEAKFADVGFATRVWDSLVRGLLGHGTTTAVYFGSIHEPATLALARVCLELGQRAFVGRVGMDHPAGTPEWYRDIDAGRGVAASHRSITEIQALDPSGLVRPIVTPRFIPACTDAMLQGLGELAAATGTPVQTHCSESDWEHGHVLERYGATDSVVLERFGLAGRHAVLAHSDHITPADQQLLASTGAGVAHCPLSNSYFGNAVLPVRQVLESGVKVGLGSDIAGGAAPGLLRQCEHAVTVSRMLEDGVDPALPAERRGRMSSRLDIVAAFHLATVGGADVLGLNAGIIGPGNVFDAIVVRTGDGTSIGVWPDVDDEQRVFEKIVRLATAHDITTVWVNGRATLGTEQAHGRRRE